MKKPIVRETELPIDIVARLDDLGAKLDELNILVRAQNEVLHRLAPNEEKPLPSQIVAQHQRQPQYGPSSHGASLEARSHNLEALAFGRSGCAEEPAEPNMSPRVHPTLGTL